MQLVSNGCIIVIDSALSFGCSGSRQTWFLCWGGVAVVAIIVVGRWRVGFGRHCGWIADTVGFECKDRKDNSSCRVSRAKQNYKVKAEQRWSEISR
jgi:hypothetical protein